MEIVLKRRISVHERLPEGTDQIDIPWLKQLIESMLQPQPWLRPSTEKVLAALNSPL